MGRERIDEGRKEEESKDREGKDRQGKEKTDGERKPGWGERPRGKGRKRKNYKEMTKPTTTKPPTNNTCHVDVKSHSWVPLRHSKNGTDQKVRNVNSELFYRINSALYRTSGM